MSSKRLILRFKGLEDSGHRASSSQAIFVGPNSTNTPAKAIKRATDTINSQEEPGADKRLRFHIVHDKEQVEMSPNTLNRSLLLAGKGHDLQEILGENVDGDTATILYDFCERKEGDAGDAMVQLTATKNSTTPEVSVYIAAMSPLTVTKQPI